MGKAKGKGRAKAKAKAKSKSVKAKIIKAKAAKANASACKKRPAAHDGSSQHLEAPPQLSAPDDASAGDPAAEVAQDAEVDDTNAEVDDTVAISAVVASVRCPRDVHLLADFPIHNAPIPSGALSLQPTADPKLADPPQYLCTLVNSMVGKLSDPDKIALLSYLKSETFDFASLCAGTDCPRLVTEAYVVKSHTLLFP